MLLGDNHSFPPVSPPPLARDRENGGRKLHEHPESLKKLAQVGINITQLPKTNPPNRNTFSYLPFCFFPLALSVHLSIPQFQQGMGLPSEVWPRDCNLRKAMCLGSLSQLLSPPLGEVEVSSHPQEMVKPRWRGLVLGHRWSC